MVIDDLDVPRRSVTPGEADAELIVDADAPLSNPIAREFLQPVLWRHTQSFNARGGMYHLKLSHCHSGNVGETGDTCALEQGFGIPAPERLDHGKILTHSVSIVKSHSYRVPGRCPGGVGLGVMHPLPGTCGDKRHTLR